MRLMILSKSVAPATLVVVVPDNLSSQIAQEHADRAIEQYYKSCSEDSPTWSGLVDALQKAGFAVPEQFGGPNFDLPVKSLSEESTNEALPDPSVENLAGTADTKAQDLPDLILRLVYELGYGHGVVERLAAWMDDLDSEHQPPEAQRLKEGIAHFNTRTEALFRESFPILAPARARRYAAEYLAFRDKMARISSLAPDVVRQIVIEARNPN